MGYTIWVESEEGFGWEHYERTLGKALDVAEREIAAGNTVEITDSNGDTVEYE